MEELDAGGKECPAVIHGGGWLAIGCVLFLLLRRRWSVGVGGFLQEGGCMLWMSLWGVKLGEGIGSPLSPGGGVWEAYCRRMIWMTIVGLDTSKKSFILENINTVLVWIVIGQPYRTRSSIVNWNTKLCQCGIPA